MNTLRVYAIDGIVPVVDPTAFVHPTAVLIGDVIVGPGCYVGPCASLRGDFGRLILERGANLQDTCVMHGFPGTDTIVGEDGHIGHGARGQDDPRRLRFRAPHAAGVGDDAEGGRAGEAGRRDLIAVALQPHRVASGVGVRRRASAWARSLSRCGWR